MDNDAKKTALRSITYGLYVVTAIDGDDVGAAAMNWLTQDLVRPALVGAALKSDSGACALAGSSGAFAVNVLGADRRDIAKAFFRSTSLEDGKINGHPFEPGPSTGAPLLTEPPSRWECRVVDRIEQGDHWIFVGEVVEAGVRDGEAAPLELRPTGMNYGG
jgi:flavin reductase (DIM6/NTAB) family NADH-FMN oxidoreductase RutF